MNDGKLPSLYTKETREYSDERRERHRRLASPASLVIT